MSSARLYYDDPLLFAFDARVLEHATWKDAPSIVLDRSAFYPESGGQMADRGTLAGVAVIDVQAGEDGRVHHVLEKGAALPAVGGVVHGAIDAARRRTHMALHTAQHLLSRALVEVAAAETTSSRLGETACTVDVDRDAVADAKIAEAESLVNALVDEDRPVRAWFPTAEELPTLALRRAPKAEHASVRVVDAGGFDVSPCGGTHVLRTAQIGLLRVIGTERYKGGTRVTFSAGPRARRELLGESAQLRDLARALGCAPAEAKPAALRTRDALDAAREELGRMRSSLAKSLAERAEARGDARVAIVEGGIDLVRQVAAELTREGDRLAIVAGPVEGGTHVVVARGPSGTADARTIFAAIAKAAGGRGGGRPERAEGRMPEAADVRAAIAAALS
jgi:alanyl-tRNA synthetase